MANISRDTFNKMKHYVSVRLQQGVPLVDADWNEMEDIRRFELQAFLKWFVGDGVPVGNDGFRIKSINGENDFTIQGGDGTPEGAGRCLVEGWDVMIESDLKYTEQDLFKNPQLSKDWGVDPLLKLTTPVSDRSDAVYLDVWEREVNATEDRDHLVNQAIDIETCVRLKREWVVRVAEGANTGHIVPAAPKDHVFYVLAQLNRPKNTAPITAEHIVDQRVTGLAVVSHHDIDQIVKDAYGTSYKLDHDGQPNLEASLREAINALLCGCLPCSSEQLLTTTTGGSDNYKPFALEDNTGDFWVFWERESNGASDIWYKRYHQETGKWDPDMPLTNTTESDYKPFALEDDKGDLWAFWERESNGASDIWYKRYQKETSKWDNDILLTDNPDILENQNPVALKDIKGNLWVFWVSGKWRSLSSDPDDNDPQYQYFENSAIQTKVYNSKTNTWEMKEGHNRYSSEEVDCKPFALKDRKGYFWLFLVYKSLGKYGICYKRYHQETGKWEPSGSYPGTPLTNTTGYEYTSFALEDNTGDLWVFWERKRNGASDIWYKRYHQETGTWSPDTSLANITGYDYEPFALEDNKGNLWVFWKSYRNANAEIWYRKLLREI